jgi:hypothetical protein
MVDTISHGIVYVFHRDCPAMVRVLQEGDEVKLKF